MSVKWISHRGESVDAPENTLEAFRLSLERNTDGMECDVQLTKDRRVVVAHDGDTARMGDVRKVIGESNFEELVRVNIVDVNGRFPVQHIPLFADTLPYLGLRRQYYVELKPGCPGLAPAVADILKPAGLSAEQIVIISFDRELIRLSKKLMPHYKALFLTSFTPEMTTEKLIGALKDMHADGVDAFADENFLTEECIDKLHGAGMFAAVWTVDQPGQARRLMAAGVDSITSNRAAQLRKIITGE